MIYEHLNTAAPIQQGDVFRDIPIVDLVIGQEGIPISDPDDIRQKTWQDILNDGEPQVSAILPVRKTIGIVISQNCDIARLDGNPAARVTLAEIRPIKNVMSFDKGELATPKTFVNSFMKKSCNSIRWFYLPPDGPLADGNIGLTEKMAVDLHVVFTLRGQDLLSMKSHRMGKLNKEAYEHFRENLAQFLRRYPVDEWYPLNREEFEAYKEMGGGREHATPRPWQAAEAVTISPSIKGR